MEAKTVTVKVPVIEEKTVMETRKKFETYTEYKTKTVDKGHYECEECPAGPSILDRLTHKCPDPCKTKTVKKWVSCCVTECVPVCKTRCVTECVPVCKKVCTHRCETHTEMVPVCKTKCVPECKTCTYTECKKVCVPYQATRCVTVCEPVCETFTVCKMVPHQVEKEVACAAPCGARPVAAVATPAAILAARGASPVSSRS